MGNKHGHGGKGHGGADSAGYDGDAGAGAGTGTAGASTNNDTNIGATGSATGTAAASFRLYVVRYASATPATLSDSIALWETRPDLEAAKKRFALSRAVAVSDEMQAPDIFVSHTWYDKAFIGSEGVRHDAGQLGVSEAHFFFDLKTTGVRKGAGMLYSRARYLNSLSLENTEHRVGIRSLDHDLQSWRLWMDLCCVDQTSSGHKAHVTDEFETYIERCRGLIVLLSPAYFTRLWCVFEYCCFLYHHDLNDVAVYSWAFADAAYRHVWEDVGNIKNDGKFNYDNVSVAAEMTESIRNLRVGSVQCSHEADRAKLVAKVCQRWVSIKAFERFAKFAGISLILIGLFLSPAIYSESRRTAFICPWIRLASDLGFENLANSFDKFDAVSVYMVYAKTGEKPETNSSYAGAVASFVGSIITPMIQKEKMIAVRKA